VWLASGVDISARYLLTKVAHWTEVVAAYPNFIVPTLGAKFGNQTSYQFCDANSDFDTPRGERRTVPIRNPSPLFRAFPSLTKRMAISTYSLCPHAQRDCRKS